MKGAYFEVMSDLLSSVGVLAAATLIWLSGRRWIDPLFSVLIGAFILPRAWVLLREAADVLLEAVPKDFTLAKLEQTLRQVPGVVSVHELHVWTITSGRHAASAHIRVRPNVDEQIALRVLSTLLREQKGFEHVALQIEKGPLNEVSQRD